jgi:hypothetical protein
VCFFKTLHLFPEMKEPENINFGRNKQQSQQFSNDNNNNNNNNININNNNQIESKNFYEGKRDEIKKTEISNVESGNVENPDRGAGIYYVSFGKTTESFNFGSGRETHIRDDDEDLVRITFPFFQFYQTYFFKPF